VVGDEVTGLLVGVGLAVGDAGFTGTGVGFDEGVADGFNVGLEDDGFDVKEGVADGLGVGTGGGVGPGGFTKNGTTYELSSVRAHAFEPYGSQTKPFMPQLVPHWLRKIQYGFVAPVLIPTAWMQWSTLGLLGHVVMIPVLYELNWDASRQIDRGPMLST